MARAQYWHLTARLRLLDENGADVTEPLEIDSGQVATDMHRATDHKVAENYAAFGEVATGGITGSVMSPSIVAVYSPQNFRIAFNNASDLTTAVNFNSYTASDGTGAPTANLVIVARTDGGDTGLDTIDLANAAAAASNANDAFPVIISSGQDS
jgi:hypothetical protein